MKNLRSNKKLKIMKKLPHFIFGGVQKSGTIILTNLLINHPKVHIIKRDMDLAFFDDERIYRRKMVPITF
jgi:hypothetical protein